MKCRVKNFALQIKDKDMRISVQTAGYNAVVERWVANSHAPLDLQTQLVTSTHTFTASSDERRIRVWVPVTPPWFPRVEVDSTPLCNYVQIGFTRFGAVEIEHDATMGLCHGYQITIKTREGDTELACGFAPRVGLSLNEETMYPSDTTKTDSCNVASDADCRIAAQTSDSVARAMQCCNDVMQEWSIKPSSGYCNILKTHGCHARCWRFDRECDRDQCSMTGAGQRRPWLTVPRADIDEVEIRVSPVAEALSDALRGYENRPHPGVSKSIGMCPDVESTRGLVGCKTRMSLTGQIAIFVTVCTLLLLVWGGVLWFRV